MKPNPKLGNAADRIWEIKDQIAHLNTAIANLDQERKELEQYLITSLPKSDAKGVMGLRAKAVIKTEDIGSVDDWDALYAHIIKRKDFSLLQKRLSQAAIKEQWEAGVKLPGVRAFTVIKVSVTKV